MKLFQTLRNEQPVGVALPYKQQPEGDKVSRVAGVSAMIAGGQMILPEHAPWLIAFTSELLAFPNGKHDDQVDALSQVLTWMSKFIARRADSAPFPPMLYDAHGPIDPYNPRPCLENDWYDMHGDCDPPDYEPGDEWLY